jgi:hypothetical protein
MGVPLYCVVRFLVWAEPLATGLRVDFVAGLPLVREESS